MRRGILRLIFIKTIAVADWEMLFTGKQLGNVANQDAKPLEIRISKGCVLEAETSKYRQEQGRQEGDNQTVDKGADDRSPTAASGIAKYTSGTTHKEVRNQARDDHSQIGETQDEHTNDAANKARDEADNNSIWGKGEHNWAIDRRLGIRNDFVSNALESWDDFSQHHANTLKDNRNPRRKG